LTHTVHLLKKICKLKFYVIFLKISFFGGGRGELTLKTPPVAASVQWNLATCCVVLETRASVFDGLRRCRLFNKCSHSFNTVGQSLQFDEWTHQRSNTHACTVHARLVNRLVLAKTKLGPSYSYVPVVKIYREHGWLSQVRNRCNFCHVADNGQQQQQWRSVYAASRTTTNHWTTTFFCWSSTSSHFARWTWWV